MARSSSVVEKRKEVAAGAHKTKSKEFYDIIRRIGADVLGLPRASFEPRSLPSREDGLT